MLAFFRSLQKIFNPYLSRTEWAIKILRLKKEQAPFSHPGLVIIQIDGFPLTQFKRAIERRRMPFIGTLLHSGKYKLHTFYSGVPSVTPSVQGEILYGIKTAVPAFNFFDRKNQKIRTMYERDSASFVEQRLQGLNDGLLKGGASYSNIYTGGAKEAHYCAADWGIAGFFHAINPFFLPFFALCYIDIFIRTFALLLVELYLSILECIKGTLHGWNFFKELEYIWVRVLACILLREFVTIGTCMDLSRGLPIIHLNLIGYDEQAHRRGPSSAYAHWTLRGIDDCVERIFRAAKYSPRDYQVWIFSDHGQHRTIPYPKLQKETLRETLLKILNETTKTSSSIPKVQSGWVRREKGFLDALRKPSQTILPDELVVTDMGPEAHVYFPQRLAGDELEKIILRVLNETPVPMAMVPLEGQKIMAWTRKGRYILPEQMAEVVGEDHPFLKDLSQDIIGVCHHPDAGDVIFSGWAKGEQAIAYPLENGSHGGMGVDETMGFLMAPPKAPLNEGNKEYLRPLDLRFGAQAFMRNETERG